MAKEKKLNFFEALTMALGFTIGSGIITQTGIGMTMTGRSICLAFPVSAILFLIAFRPLFIMGIVMPKVSASYSYAKELLSPKAGGLFIYIYFLGRITIAVLCISFAQYSAQIIPGLSGTSAQKLCAAGIATIFYVVNLKGIKTAAMIQKGMCFVLLAGMLIYIAAGFSQLMPNFIDRNSFFTGGFQGFYAASSLFFFAVGGSYILIDFAPKIENSRKVIPQVIKIVTFGVSILYTLLGITASGTVPLEQAAGQPLTVSAAAVFSNFTPLYWLFLTGVCLGALITTLNSSFVWYSNSLLAGCEDGWLPKKLAVKNKYGVPWLLMTVFYLFAAIPALAGMDLTELSRIAISLTILSAAIPMAGILYLPEKCPKAWEENGFEQKYPTWRRRGMLIITYGILLSQIYSLISQNSVRTNLLLFLYCAAAALYPSIKKTASE